MKLYGYWRSSCSYRVRIGLALKGLAYDQAPVHLLHAAQREPGYVALNPMAQVPSLEVEDGGRTLLLTQSIAILEYLEERYPQPRLLPDDRVLRAEVRRAVEIINAGIQPLQNLSLLRTLKGLGADEQAFGREANEKGLAALEDVATRAGGAHLVGDAPTLADVCIVPQLYAARRFAVDVARFPRLLAVEARCVALDGFAAAHPDRQPDATPS